MSTRRHLPVVPPDWLDEIVVGEACGQAWEAMPGSDRVRHCDHCGKDVHNLQAMTRKEIAALTAAAVDAPPCIRMARHPSGALLTADRRAGGIMRALVVGWTVAIAAPLTLLAQIQGVRTLRGLVERFTTGSDAAGELAGSGSLPRGREARPAPDESLRMGRIARPPADAPEIGDETAVVQGVVIRGTVGAMAVAKGPPRKNGKKRHGR